MSGTPIISVRDVRRSFRTQKKEEGAQGTFNLLLKPQFTVHDALKGVSFDIEEGAFIGLIGANGAGKTTLLKILSGLIPPSSGTATVMGYTPFDRAVDFRQKIALVMGQKAQLWWDLPAVDAFDLLRAIYQIPPATYRQRLKLLSELLEVDKHLNTQIRRLSLGERMKMELIGAILHWPKVIYLDEPTIGLDIVAAQKLREFLREFNRREKATIILTSHNMEDIERLCSRVMIIRSGEMIFDGAPGKLTGAGERRLRVRMMESPEIAELSAVSGINPTEISVGTLDGDGDGEDPEGLQPIYFSVSHETLMPTLQKLMAKYRIVDMGIEEPGLDKVIQRIFEGGTT